MTGERSFRFFRCPNGSVAFDSVFSGNTVYQLDRRGMCPLCRTPVAEHATFTLRASREKQAGENPPEGYFSPGV